MSFFGFHGSFFVLVKRILNMEVADMAKEQDEGVETPLHDDVRSGGIARPERRDAPRLALSRQRPELLQGRQCGPLQGG